MFTLEEVAGKIEQTLLKPTAGKKDYQSLVETAKKYGFKAVCVPSYYVPFCVEQLSDSAVQVVSVVGFPLGTCLTEVKIYEAQRAFLSGARGVDVVINMGALKAGSDQAVLKDLQGVVKEAAKFMDKEVKVIIETGLLTEEEIKRACALVIKAGADYVKTSTGFNCRGAVLEDLYLIKALVGETVKIKASGGISTWAEAHEFLKAGANCLGTSNGVRIIEEFLAK